jgi:hypothetical protein
MTRPCFEVKHQDGVATTAVNLVPSLTKIGLLFLMFMQVVKMQRTDGRTYAKSCEGGNSSGSGQDPVAGPWEHGSGPSVP